MPEIISNRADFCGTCKEDVYEGESVFWVKGYKPICLPCRKAGKHPDQGVQLFEVYTPKPTVMRAKFDSSCRFCRKKIREGDAVYYVPGHLIACAGCRDSADDVSDSERSAKLRNT